MAETLPKIYGRIRKYILTSMILVPAVPFALILCIGYFYFAASLTGSGKASLRRIVQDHQLMIDAFLQERRADLEFVQNTYDFAELGEPAALERVFGHLRKNSEAFADLGVFDADGMHVAYHGMYRLSGKNYSEAEWFREVMKTGRYISDVFTGYRNSPHFIVAVSHGQGRDRWVLRATIDTLFFNRLVGNVRIGESGEAFVLNRKGIFQTRRRSGGELMQKDPDFAGYPGRDGGVRLFVLESVTGGDYLYAAAPLDNGDWVLVVRQAKADAFQYLKTATWMIVAVALLGGGGIVLFAYYITERIVQRIRKVDAEKSTLEDQLIRAGRLAELGEMAAGFAHEINNPLQIMKSEQALVGTVVEQWRQSGELADSEDLRDVLESVGQIAVQIDRCSRITHAILKFGRKSEPEPGEVDLHALVPELVAMVNEKAKVHGVVIEQEVAPGTPGLFGDPAQLQQVLLNLLNNALDAVIARHGVDGGCIRVRAASPEPSTVEIRVEDNGCGIDPENLKKIFSPFYTTKPVGQGTGLGLSICYGIVAGMNGAMSVSSRPGEGAAFCVRLPAVGAAVDGGIWTNRPQKSGAA